MSALVSLSWDAVSAAVALLAAEHESTGDDQAAIVGTVPPDQVITALTLITGATLRTTAGREGTTGFLRHLGLRVLTEASR